MTTKRRKQHCPEPIVKQLRYADDVLNAGREWWWLRAGAAMVTLARSTCDPRRIGAHATEMRRRFRLRRMPVVTAIPARVLCRVEFGKR